ncbi:MAG: FAD-dependent oxidoreductase [Planctomycetes bacterium]|nr:FAD-dependent oxidoreductase [Planctomycetota bacterium]
MAPVSQLDASARQQRRAWFQRGIAETDVLVLGGGALGAATYHHLRRAGQRVVLAERHDFAAGSSQGSAGLVWGGLLYLRHGHLREVATWCRERDRLRRDLPHLIAPHTCAYRRAPRRRSPWMVGAGLGLYWLLGAGRVPRRRGAHLLFEEARLIDSDTRFTWEWIACAPGACTAFNRCSAETSRRCANGWEVDLVDHLDGQRTTLRTRWVINACGPWAAQVDEQAGIDLGWRLMLSRGTSLVVSGQRTSSEIIEHPTQDDALSLVPFADASIWGSTETVVSTPTEGFTIPPQEISDLVAWYNHLVGPLTKAEVIALRVGVRALAVPAAASPRDSRAAARAFRVLPHARLPWISLYGGKLSGCAAVARQVVRHLTGRTPPKPSLHRHHTPTFAFPGVPHPVVDPRWSRDHEQCWSLGDWLRRRTTIAQLVPRGGCGHLDEHLETLAAAALVFADGDEHQARRDLDDYRTSVIAHHDRLLGLTTPANAGTPHVH